MCEKYSRALGLLRNNSPGSMFFIVRTRRLIFEKYITITTIVAP